MRLLGRMTAFLAKALRRTEPDSSSHELKNIGKAYRVLQHVTLRYDREQQEIDNLVIGPNGVFHIETKTYSGSLVFHSSGLTHDGREIEDPTGQVYRHQYILESILAEAGVTCDIFGIICFSDPQCTLTGASSAFITCRSDQLLYEIKTKVSNHFLTKAAIDKIVMALEKSGAP
nr:nuclease-related domain-containing protein [Paenibacillus soyae]